MRTNLLGVLGSALFAAGCGGKHSVGENLPDCRWAANDEVSLAPDIDGFEIRELCESYPEPTLSIKVYGESCAKTTCADEVARLDANYTPTVGPSTPGAPLLNCQEYVVAMRDGKVAFSNYGFYIPIADLIGSVDSRDEAEIVVDLKNIPCVRSGKAGGSFLVIDHRLRNPRSRARGTWSTSRAAFAHPQSRTRRGAARVSRGRAGAALWRSRHATCGPCSADSFARGGSQRKCARRHGQ